VFGRRLVEADDITAQLLEGKSDILWRIVIREVTNYCFDRLIRIWVESEVLSQCKSYFANGGRSVSQSVSLGFEPLPGRTTRFLL
jgi:hypothetical protein